MKYVLFVCDHNAGRSQLAQALFECDAPADIRAESAGSDPADAIWPGVLDAMRELGFGPLRPSPSVTGPATLFSSHQLLLGSPFGRRLGAPQATLRAKLRLQSSQKM